METRPKSRACDGAIQARRGYFAPNPHVSNDLLWVENPNDKDIKRLCSEILGVGAALELLISSGVVDGRTIKKFVCVRTMPTETMGVSFFNTWSRSASRRA